MDLLGFSTTEQLTEFLNSRDQPTGNMVPQGQIQRDMQILVKGKEEIHRLFMSIDGEVRREIDTGIADKLLTEERAKDHRQMAGSLTAGQAVLTKSLDAVYRVCEGLTQQASELGLGKVTTTEDLFKIEQKILNNTPQHRTLGETQLLARMRVVRAAAQDQVLQQLAEVTAAEFRVESENARNNAVKEAVEVSIQTEGTQHSHAEMMANGCKPDAEHAQQSGDFSHSKAAAYINISGSESAAKTLRQTQSEDQFKELGSAAWEGIVERARFMSTPESRTITANERIIKTETVSADCRDVNHAEHKGPVIQRSRLDTSDDDLIAQYERENSGIRAIWKFLRETAWGLGLVLGWTVQHRKASSLRPLSDTSQLSVRRTWPFLAGAGVVTAWLFSPFNVVPALVLLTVTLTVGFKILKKRSSPILLKSALLFLALFVPMGMIHDKFFDHPTALCSDGTYSYSHHRSGTCSGHAGVSRWQPERKHWWQIGSEYASGTPSFHRRSRRIPSPLQ